MEFYQHEFERVEDYLHHRPPYLMVDAIESISSNQVVTSKTFANNDQFVTGHFPGSPIFPGALMQELTTQSAGILIAAKFNPMEQFNTEDPFFNEYALGVLVKVKNARFKSFARPGDKMIAAVRLDNHLDNVFDFASTITVDDKLVMRNEFRLTNIKSKVLQGVS